MKKFSLFLGGTCNKSTWRDELLEKLDLDKFDAYNPIVPNWTKEDEERENYHKVNDDICLYVFTPESVTSPQKGYYSIAEVVDDSNKRPFRTIFAIINYGGLDFTPEEFKGLSAVARVIKENGVKVFYNLDQIAEYLKVL